MIPEGEPIKAGDRLIWEPDKPHARQRVTVVRVIVNADGEEWVLTADEGGCEFWNDGERTREACVRDE